MMLHAESGLNIRLFRIQVVHEFPPDSHDPSTVPSGSSLGAITVRSHISRTKIISSPVFEHKIIIRLWLFELYENSVHSVGVGVFRPGEREIDLCGANKIQRYPPARPHPKGLPLSLMHEEKWGALHRLGSQKRAGTFCRPAEARFFVI